MKNIIVMTVMTAAMLTSLLMMRGTGNLSVLSQFAAVAFVITLGTFAIFAGIALWMGRVGPAIRNNLSIGVYALAMSVGLYFVTVGLPFVFYFSLVIAVLIPTVIEIEVHRSVYTSRWIVWLHLGIFAFFAFQIICVAVALLLGGLYTAVAVTLLPVAVILAVLLLRPRGIDLM